MSILKKGLALIILAFVILVIFLIFYPSKTEEVVARAEAVGSVATDKVLTAMEKRVGASRVAIEHLKSEKERRRSSLVDLKAARLDLQRRAEETAREAETVSDEAKAARLRSTQQMLETKAKDMEESVNKAETLYKDFLKSYELKKEELSLVELKLEVLRTELDALGKGAASASSARAKAIEEELKGMCSKLEAEIEVSRLED